MLSSSATEILKKYEPMILGLVELFHPFLEVAVHDLKSGKIIFLQNSISRRKIGDTSPLQELKVKTKDFPDFFPPYYKENWDGKSLKCTSITLRDDQGIPIGLICFNFDTSNFKNFQSQIDLFLKIRPQSENPVDTFSENWKNTLSDTIKIYLQVEKLSLENMTRVEKRKMVKFLYEKGVFNYKNAPTYIANTLKISRATIYNYLE